MGNIYKRPRNLPLVVVLGATACGKSKLAIELAQKFNGEIISADSMQIYRGLDIVTNKVTLDEQNQAKHHMIDIASPLERYSIVDFRDKSLKLIDSLRNEGKLTIVVGGTHYYIESILWEQFLIKPSDRSPSNNQDTKYLIDNELEDMVNVSSDLVHTEEDLTAERILKKPIYIDSFKDVPNIKLWSILEQLDPISAYTYHPNDVRRVKRALQVMQQEKIRFTNLLDSKNSLNGRFSRGGQLRYVPTCVFWLDCDRETLDKCLDDRVDQMLERGLLQELRDFHEEYNMNRMKDNLPHDYTKGVFQCIGFKEFHEYLTLPDEASKSSKEGLEKLQKSIENMKISTKRYARKQLQWISRRLLDQGHRDLPPIFRLNVTKVLTGEEDWNDSIKQTAFKVLHSLIEGTILPDDVMPFLKEPEQKWSVQNCPGKFYCECCDKTVIGSYLWDKHIKSRRHQKCLASLRKSQSAKINCPAQIGHTGGSNSESANMTI